MHKTTLLYTYVKNINQDHAPFSAESFLGLICLHQTSIRMTFIPQLIIKTVNEGPDQHDQMTDDAFCAI